MREGALRVSKVGSATFCMNRCHFERECPLQGDAFEAVRIREHGADGDHQNLPKIVPRTVA
jgi:hypothetical protein